MFGATFGIAVGLGRTPPPPLRAEPSIPRGRDRLRLRRAAHCGAGAVRLALRPDLRHRRDRHVGAISGRGAPAAAPRRCVAGRADAGVVVRLCGAAVRDVVGPRPVHARHVQHAHGGPHAAVDAGAGAAGARRTGHVGAAGASHRRPRRAARTARVAAGGAALPGLPVPDPPGRRDRVVRRRASTGCTSAASSTPRSATTPRTY